MHPLRLAAASLAALAASIGLAAPAVATDGPMRVSWKDKCDRTVDLVVTLRGGIKAPSTWTVDITDDGKAPFPVQIKTPYGTEAVKVTLDADKLTKVTATRPKAGPVADTETFTATYPGWKQPHGCTKPCVSIIHKDTKDIALTAAGKVDLKADGLEITTGAIPDKAQWKRTLPQPVKMWQVTGLSYTNTKTDDGKTNAAALVAYHVYLTVPTKDGDVQATLVYEPYYQITGNPELGKTKTWDVLDGKFWVSKTIPGLAAEAGGSYAGNKTWQEILKANPKAVVTGFGFGQGTYNAGTTSTLSQPKGGAAVTFKSTVVSECHDWTKPKPPATTPAATVPATNPPAAGGPELPKTGIKALNLVLLGVFTLVLGGTIVAASVIGKRRRRYIA